MKDWTQDGKGDEKGKEEEWRDFWKIQCQQKGGLRSPLAIYPEASQ
jgi:hypothetical protein